MSNKRILLYSWHYFIHLLSSSITQIVAGLGGIYHVGYVCQLYIVKIIMVKLRPTSRSGVKILPIISFVILQDSCGSENRRNSNTSDSNNNANGQFIPPIISGRPKCHLRRGLVSRWFYCQFFAQYEGYKYILSYLPIRDFWMCYKEITIHGLLPRAYK